MNSYWCPLEALFEKKRVRGSRCDLHLFGNFFLGWQRKRLLSPILDSQQAPRMEVAEILLAYSHDNDREEQPEISETNCLKEAS